jgi:hypothetical protein
MGGVGRRISGYPYMMMAIWNPGMGDEDNGEGSDKIITDGEVRIRKEGMPR